MTLRTLSALLFSSAAIEALAVGCARGGGATGSAAFAVVFASGIATLVADDNPGTDAWFEGDGFAWLEEMPEGGDVAQRE